jgi:hypothetical protein
MYNKFIRSTIHRMDLGEITSEDISNIYPAILCLHREQRCLSLGRCGRLLVPEGICQVVSTSTLTWFIRYIYY